MDSAPQLVTDAVEHPASVQRLKKPKTVGRDAESLGRARNRKGEEVHTGQTPIAALGTTDQHSQVQLYIEGPNDKVFTFCAVEKFAATGKFPRSTPGSPRSTRWRDSRSRS